MNSYDLSRKFVDFSFENPSKIRPNHYALYFFAIEHCNRLGWKKEFGLPTTMTMEAIGIKSYNTYINTFNELVEYGFFTLVEKSKNQYSSNIVELSNFDKALDKALDKAFIKHSTKQSESTGESIDSINKPIYNKPIYNEPVNQSQTKNYSASDFINDWNTTRKEVLNKKSCLNRIGMDESEIIKKLNKEDIVPALKGLFKQTNFPRGQDYTVNAKHFLNHFDIYLQAYHDKNANVWGEG
jgi:hypothetical protein